MITSNINPQIKNILQIIKKPKARREQKLFAAEGIKMFREAPIEQIKRVYVAAFRWEAWSAAEREELFCTLPQGSIEIVADKVFNTISDTVTPQGILCLLYHREYEPDELLQLAHSRGEQPFLMLLEDLQDPGNLGTIMRAAEGAGVHGVILGKSCVDIYNPKTIRSTMGSIYRVPFLYVDSLLDIQPFLNKSGILSYAAHLEGACAYYQRDYRQACAFYIGNAGNGLSQELTAKADYLVKIPMAGKLESLNAAMAAGILMYEVARQRFSSYII